MKIAKNLSQDNFWGKILARYFRYRKQNTPYQKEVFCLYLFLTAQISLGTMLMLAQDLSLVFQ